MTFPNVTLRNYDIAELRRLDVAHHLPAQQDYRADARAGGSRIITRAEGSTIYDGDGDALLDGMAGLWCVNVGYGREELAEAADEQMLELPYYNTFFKTVDAADGDAGAPSWPSCPGGNLNHVFFTNSGSEANDTIVRMVRYFWAGRRASRARTSSSPATTATTARPSPAPAWAA